MLPAFLQSQTETNANGCKTQKVLPVFLLSLTVVLSASVAPPALVEDWLDDVSVPEAHFAKQPEVVHQMRVLDGSLRRAPTAKCVMRHPPKACSLP
ncbi:hypothetical protein Poly41_40440 [Novipirellula artificiosorum]|uniref:Uncharacterized protein n=1 Tax=Novipirellula artificiosorum TaxID=2528016 RepID=A0A5C6DGQ0_9BACT|nr:hypothetical protein Poly41_40440 [Novipirellula artificiosorum]